MTNVMERALLAVVVSALIFAPVLSGQEHPTDPQQAQEQEKKEQKPAKKARSQKAGTTPSRPAPGSIPTSKKEETTEARPAGARTYAPHGPHPHG